MALDLTKSTPHFSVTHKVEFIHSKSLSQSFVVKLTDKVLNDSADSYIDKDKEVIKSKPYYFLGYIYYILSFDFPDEK